MVEPNQQQQTEEPKFQLFKPSEWPGFAWNWFWRLPGVRRFRVGRAKVGERYPQILYDLRKTWFPKNKAWFETKLETIEEFWKVMGNFYGDEKDDTGEGSLLGNPDGIVRFYQDLGVYSDIERVRSEANWFQVGTDYALENITTSLPNDPKFWARFGWNKRENIIEVINNPERLKSLLIERVRLSHGTVHHEGKKEYEEELYCFGFPNAEQLANRINKYNDTMERIMLDLGIDADIRGAKTRAAGVLQHLINKIAEIEKETFVYLSGEEGKSGLSGKIATYQQKWEDLVNKLSPESKKIGVIRFPHTYRIIKQYNTLEIEERITIRDGVVMDEEGNAIRESTKKRQVTMKLKQDKDIYKEEEDELNEKIKELKKDLNQNRIPIEQIEQYNLRIKMYEQRLDDIKNNDNDTCNIINKADIIRQTIPKVNRNDFWQRSEELGFGLDENGYPLEIDPKTGEVLIDRWWSEISQNEWQLKTIAGKPGGLKYLKKHLDGFEARIGGPRGKPEVEIVNNGSRPKRYLKDERFYGYVDLLELGHIIFSDWDSFRDDLRDGRFHPHSKSAGDYVIEAMGNFDEQLGAPYFKGWYLARSKGIGGIRRRGVIPLSTTGIYTNVADKNVLTKARPDKEFLGIDFNKVPKEERAITRNYKMRMPDGSFIEGERKPTKYNPAFDRRAENLDYVYWGRMYWYEWISAVGRWSENPFPHVSTRGIALYIAHLVATDVWNSKDALEGHKFDYGVRGQGEYGYVNPLSGKGILQEN